jgi:hypothetical protein
MSTLPDPSTKRRCHGARLLLSWVWVGVPLAWGVWQTLMKSLDLFR